MKQFYVRHDDARDFAPNGRKVHGVEQGVLQVTLKVRLKRVDAGQHLFPVGALGNSAGQSSPHCGDENFVFGLAYLWRLGALVPETRVAAMLR